LLKWSLNKYQKVIESMMDCPELADKKPQTETLIRLLGEVNGLSKSEGSDLEPKLLMLLNLVQGLLLVNVFEDSFDDSFEAVQDLIMIIQKLKFSEEKPKKKKKVQETGIFVTFLKNIRIERKHEPLRSTDRCADFNLFYQYLRIKKLARRDIWVIRPRNAGQLLPADYRCFDKK
jgi:hypothetical protein